MKEAIGGISIFQIVIVFVLLFAGIMCLTINYTRAYGVKDEVINIIQKAQTKNGMISNEAIEEIAKHLQETGHMITGNCPSGYTGYDRGGNMSSNASFCLKANAVSDAYINDAHEKCAKSGCKVASDDELGMHYYSIVLFYQIDIPGLNNVLHFDLKGSTKIMFGDT